MSARRLEMLASFIDQHSSCILPDTSPVSQKIICRISFVALPSIAPSCPCPGQECSENSQQYGQPASSQHTFPSAALKPNTCRTHSSNKNEELLPAKEYRQPISYYLILDSYKQTFFCHRDVRLTTSTQLESSYVVQNNSNIYLCGASSIKYQSS